jgi:hypothetical protein
MLPSGLRRSIRKQAIWRAYAQNLYANFVPEAAPGHRVGMATLQAYRVWLEAVAQHYGPGSAFLDVTHSVEIALWFALHELATVVAEGVVEKDDDYMESQSHPKYVEFLRYAPWDGLGYLYAWDLQQWDGQDFAQPGAVVDLAHAPPLFSESPRIRAQRACLVYCGEVPSRALDLRPHLVPGTPLPVARPMTGTSAVARQVAEMFPSPAIDGWYDRLLCLPLAYAPTPQPPRLQRSIPVGVYDDPDNAGYRREIASREIALTMPLIHRYIADEPPPMAIVLEAPLVFPFPPGDSPQWHHALLATDVATACDVWEFEGSHAPKRYSLKTFFLNLIL